MIGRRLKEERERIKLSQAALAASIEVGRRTLIDWEKDASSPTGVQLSALSKAGMDVLYIITGQRLRGDQQPYFERALNTTLGASMSDEERQRSVDLLLEAHQNQARQNSERAGRYASLLRVLDTCTDATLTIVEEVVSRFRGK